MGTTEQNHRLPPAADSAKSDDRATGLPGVGGADGMGGYGRSFLSAPVGRGQENRADDVRQASAFLAQNKLMPAPTRVPDEDFLSAIEKGQTRINELAGGGLLVDGIVKPWGPTEVLSQRAVSSGRMQPPIKAPDSYPWFSAEPPEQDDKDSSADRLFQKFNMFLKQFRDDEIPFMGKTPTGGVSNRNRG